MPGGMTGGSRQASAGGRAGVGAGGPQRGSGATQSGQNQVTHDAQTSNGRTTPTGGGQGNQGQRGTPTGPADSRPGSGGLGRVPNSNQTYSGPKGTTELNQGARLASVRSQGLNMPQIPHTAQDAYNMAKMMQAESGAIKNPEGNMSIPAAQGVGDVIRNRMISDQYGPNTVNGILGQPRQFSPMQDGSFKKAKPDHSIVSVANGILNGEVAPVVGGALNYGNLNTINNDPGYSSTATKKAFNNMEKVATFADFKHPSIQHTFGTQGATDVSFGGLQNVPPTPRTQVASVNPASFEGGQSAPVSITPNGTAAAPPKDSFWGSLYDKGAQAANYVAAPVQQKIAQYGGFEKAGKLARMAVALGMGGSSSPQAPRPEGAGGTGMAALPPASASAGQPKIVDQSPWFTWVQWDPNQPPVKIPNNQLASLGVA